MQRLNLPGLDAEASRNDAGNVYVLVINQDAGDDVAARVKIAGFTPQGDAEIRTLNGPSFHAFNTLENPNAVQIRTVSKPASSGAFRHTFPAHSLTVIKFPAAPVARPGRTP